jgi:pimeloyl-ACP methyl ester carboxylesterase
LRTNRGGHPIVIRYDHRDTGRSTSYPPGQPAYSFTDLTRDTLGIQDALGIERAHLVCQSMFGGIGLIAGVDHPDRVTSLTFVSSSTGEAGLLPLPLGKALRNAIPGAELLDLEGAGHDLPRPVWDDFVSALIRHTGRGRP